MLQLAASALAPGLVSSITVHGVTAVIRALMLALFLVPFTTAAEDVYYPEYKRNPVAPLVVVDQIVKADDPARPACNPPTTPATCRILLPPSTRVWPRRSRGRRRSARWRTERR